MSSSTSNSEPGQAAARRWRRWVPTFLGTFFGGLALLYAALLLIDPYDSDRFVNLGLVGVSDRNLRTSHVSRGRDQQFDSAIYGSSTGQLLDPHRLSAATGLRFTQLTITQAGPPEVLALLGWFASRHQRIGAVVISADVEWCSDNPALNVRYPFPFWLYRGDAEYLANVLNWKTIDRAVWRVQLALGKRRPNDQVGYFDYTARSRDAFARLPPTLPELGKEGAPFPWLDRLAEAIRALPAEAAVVVVMPPVAYDYLPPPDSPAAARITRCKQALARLVSARARSTFIDDRTDSPLAKDLGNFYDRVHYRANVARLIEQQIVDALAPGPAGPMASRNLSAEIPHDRSRE